MFTNAEMQARADKELADRKRRRAEMAAGTYVQPEFSTSSQNTAPISQGTPGFVAPIYNAAVLPPKDQPYVNPYASSLANPNTIPLLSGETQEQGTARLKAQSDALEARRAARQDMQKNASVGLASGGIAALGAGGYPRRTGQISGPGTEKSDSIPAMLSDGEFVMTAKAVRGAGKGSRREGAKRMYKLMHQLEKNSQRG